MRIEKMPVLFVLGIPLAVRLPSEILVAVKQYLWPEFLRRRQPYKIASVEGIRGIKMGIDGNFPLEPTYLHLLLAKNQHNTCCVGPPLLCCSALVAAA